MYVYICSIVKSKFCSNKYCQYLVERKHFQIKIIFEKIFLNVFIVNNFLRYNASSFRNNTSYVKDSIYFYVAFICKGYSVMPLYLYTILTTTKLK